MQALPGRELPAAPLTVWLRTGPSPTLGFSVTQQPAVPTSSLKRPRKPRLVSAQASELGCALQASHLMSVFPGALTLMHGGRTGDGPTDWRANLNEAA